MKVAFAPLCDGDLEDIADYIARDSPRRALSYVIEIRRWCRSLSRFPKRFPMAPEFGTDVRRATYGAYSIYYSLRDGQILIERILHSAREIGPNIDRAP